MFRPRVLAYPNWAANTRCTRRPRATGDLDVWVDATPDNAARVMRALSAFGAPIDQITESDFATPAVTYQIGVSPGRIDILTELTRLRGCLAGTCQTSLR